MIGVMTLLVACGSPPPQTAVPTSVPPSAAAPTAVPTATVAPVATAVPTADTAPAATPAVPSGLAAIPRGKTPEGYNYLGNPDAPVVFEDFSDFF